MKYVYLFELDSVRKTDEEIIEGQLALYNEIVKNGNIVVLTYNQLVDSRGFFSLLSNADYFENLVALFKKGAIRISQYGENRTIAQYLLNSIEDDKQFIYSALPLKYCQKRLTALVKRSLMYSDLSEIHSYLSGEKDFNELEDLFVEVGSESNSKLSEQEMNTVLENLYWILSIVLRLSFIHDIYIPPRNESEYSHLKLHNILDIVLEFKVSDNQYWNEAIEIIRELHCYGTDDRSIYLREIQRLYSENSTVDVQSYQYAEIIVNLCYNYACEISICDISKHYNVAELDSTNDGMTTFKADFWSRFAQCWKNGANATERFLVSETNQYIKFQNYKCVPDFSEAIRINQYTNYSLESINAEISRYEFELDEQHRKQRLNVVKASGKQSSLLIICIIIACALELLFQWIQSATENIINLDSVILGVIETLVFLFVAEGVTNFLAQKVTWLSSLSDSLSGIRLVVKDMIHTVFQKRRTYTNGCQQGLNKKEAASCRFPIDYIKTSAIKKYIRFREENDGLSIVTQSTEYPLADVKRSEVIKQLIRDEELYQTRYGIVYESPYNTLLVDPIEKKEVDATEKKSFFPYERVIPAVDNGIVIVAMHKGNYILIEQFRHAIRKIQYGFPRGNAEQDSTIEKNIERELKEELKAKIMEQPVFLGSVVADSGLSGGTALVYLVEIEEYEANIGHEGILRTVELTKAEFMKKIRDRDIDDGFTLSAFSLLESQNQVL